MQIYANTLTFSDHALQVDYVRVIKLAHDAGLGQEVSSLLLSVPCFQCLNSHHDLSFPWQSQWPTTHLSKFTCQTEYSQQRGHREAQVNMPYQVNLHLHFEREHARYTASRYQRQAILVFTCLLIFFYCKFWLELCIKFMYILDSTVQ